MTKKETAEMDALRDQVAEAQRQTRVARALRFTEKVRPDVAPPDGSGSISELTKGFLFNEYTDTVAPACSSTSGHNLGSNEKTTTQHPRHLYSTRLLALRGLRHEVEKDAAQRLARIDKQIEQELAQ